MIEAKFTDAAARFKRWTHTALKLWHERAADPRGGYAEFMQMNGVADFDYVRRVRVQARQAYVYAHAADLDWYDQAKSACDHAWDFLVGPGFEGGDFIEGGPKGSAHLISGEGLVENDTRDTYAQAFVLLSGAYRYRAFGDREALKTTKQTLAFLDKNLKTANGGWDESLPRPKNGVRRQNPHMHLFEAFLALFEATQNHVFLDYAQDMFALFKHRFFDEKTGAIIEFFHEDWSPFNGDGGPIEPGHMMEWCWILRQYERLSGVNVNDYANALYDSAIKFGWNEKLGLICNAVNIDGSPSNANLRTWPQTELIKASIAQVMAGQNDKLAMASHAIDAVFDRYLSVPVKGGWADEIDPNGRVISANMPTSTFYHFFCAAAEADALSLQLASPRPYLHSFNQSDFDTKFS